MHRVGSLVGGKYRLNRTLGEGGMGAVWAATNELIGKEVAIKVMQPHLAKNADSLHRFFNEARICAGIRDPGIVDVLDMGTADDGSPFIVMELLEGEPLDMLIERVGRLPPDVIVPIVRDVAQTVALAHQRNVVHRDLKPANIFLHREGKQRVVKVMDFGVSKVMDDGSPYATKTGSLLGSPAYMSPEQAGGSPVDHRSDIYSLGVILYEGLSGRIPFHDAANMNALLVAIAMKEPQPLAAVAPETPPALLAVVTRAMQRDREARFSSASEMAAALEQVEPPPRSLSQEALRRSLAVTELPSRPSNSTDMSARAVTALGATIPGPTSITHSGLSRAPQGRGRVVGAVLAAVAGIGVVAAVTLSRTGDARHLATSGAPAESSSTTGGTAAGVVVEPSTETTAAATPSTITSAVAVASSAEPTSSANSRPTQVRRTGRPAPPPPPVQPRVRKADDFK